MADGRRTIDGWRAPEGSLDRTALLQILPYGEDFLFVDRVVRVTVTEVEAAFQIPHAAGYLRSHFVDLPLMPGVLIAEGLAQAASLIVRYNLAAPETKHVLAVEVERARFAALALPGDTLIYSARLGTMNRRTARLEGEARIGAKTVCRARVTVAIVDRERLRRQVSSDS